eukprot:TRINITY_DN4103_c0_g1_i1.p1 TRINITY_DN4103_c0_g1~~TRINITY_DN4103_c0_g1_i1.p1  ORF type:complete len:232 (+),score=60.19 TRINITY_DN4103_c0_g1_i1:158-853(+)
MMNLDNNSDDESVVIDKFKIDGPMKDDDMDDDNKPRYAPINVDDAEDDKSGPQGRKVAVPSHRMAPLKRDWMKIYEPIVTHLKLQIRMNTKAKCIELRTSEYTEDLTMLQKASDFLKAFMLGFEINDALALLRLDELYLESFDIYDVKMLHGDHMSRAVGRIVGKDGKTKYVIENTTRTRLVIADTKIHIMGSFNNIKIARNAVADLILGSPPGKVYAKLRTISSRISERF